ncbi:MAG TPA: hypothetical protein VHW70_08605, partial [Edaphobacter sp.]|nr:hypothetical protein [Edaphobacter sp.]
MTLLQKLSLAAVLGPATFSLAASIPKTILPDNVIRCEPNTGCTSETLHGHNYKVLTTPRFTVMVAVSHEGSYTRADVSITNKTDMPLNVTPDDFRVEVLTPKPRVLNYVPPANLVLPAPPSSAATALVPPSSVTLPPSPAPTPQSQFTTVPAAASPSPAPPSSESDALYVAEKEKAAQEG